MGSSKDRILRLAKAMGLFKLSRRVTRGRLRILCYHGIWLDAARSNPFNFLYMQPDRFARRMSLLQKSGYQVLPLDEAVKRLYEDTLPADAVAITIDDGWFGTYEHMVPELVSRRFPATIYLTTYYAEKQTAVFEVALQYILEASPTRSLCCDGLSLGLRGTYDLDTPAARAAVSDAICREARTLADATRREALLGEISAALAFNWPEASSGRLFQLMSIEEARQCAEQGIDFQLHTHRHRLYADGALCLAQELEDNRCRLARIGQSNATHFCYPSGEWQADHFPHLKAAGITSATTTDNGLCTPRTDRLALPRILDGDRISELEFEAELSGFMEVKRKLTTLFRTRRNTSEPIGVHAGEAQKN